MSSAADSRNPARVASRPEAEGLVAQVLATMRSLETAMEEETALIRVGRMRDGLAHEARKSALGGVYLQSLQTVKANAIALARFAPHAVEELKSAHARFSCVVQTNQMVLATARAVSETLVKELSNQLRQAGRPQTYGPARSLTVRQGPAEPLVISKSL